MLRPALILAVAAVAGCSTGSTTSSITTTAESNPPATSETTSSSPSVSLVTVAPVRRPGEWVAANTSGVAHLTWTVNDTEVVGSVQLARLSADGTDVTSGPVSFTGTLVGDAFTLDVGSVVWNGVVDGDEMTITYAAASGELAQFTLVPGTIADFNAGLAGLQATGARNLEAATQSSIADAEADRIVQLFFRLRGATSVLEGALEEPARFAGLDEAVAHVATDVGAVAGWIGDCGELSYAIGAVEYDVGTVEYEASLLEAHAEDLATQRDVVVALAAELDPVATSDDTAFAVVVGRHAAVRADFVINEIIERVATGRSNSQAELAAVALLDDTC